MSYISGRVRLNTAAPLRRYGLARRPGLTKGAGPAPLQDRKWTLFSSALPARCSWTVMELGGKITRQTTVQKPPGRGSNFSWRSFGFLYPFKGLELKIFFPSTNTGIEPEKSVARVARVESRPPRHSIDRRRETRVQGSVTGLMFSVKMVLTLSCAPTPRDVPAPNNAAVPMAIPPRGGRRCEAPLGSTNTILLVLVALLLSLARCSAEGAEDPSAVMGDGGESSAPPSMMLGNPTSDDAEDAAQDTAPSEGCDATADSDGSCRAQQQPAAAEDDGEPRGPFVPTYEFQEVRGRPLPPGLQIKAGRCQAA